MPKTSGSWPKECQSNGGTGIQDHPKAFLSNGGKKSSQQTWQNSLTRFISAARKSATLLQLSGNHPAILFPTGLAVSQPLHLRYRATAPPPLGAHIPIPCGKNFSRGAHAAPLVLSSRI